LLVCSTRLPVLKIERTFVVLKKLIVAILAFVYLGVAGGVMVNLHYCMGSLASLDYGSGEVETCSKCGMKEKKGCCETEYKFVKLQDEHQLAKTTIEFNQLEAEVPSYSLLAFSLSDEQSSLYLNYHSPPDPRDNDIYLHNRVFRL
jgi:hypothetical protein